MDLESTLWCALGGIILGTIVAAVLNGDRLEGDTLSDIAAGFFPKILLGALIGVSAFVIYGILSLIY